MIESERTQLAAQLANVPALRSLPPKVLSSLATDVVLYSSAPNDILIQKGEKGDTLLILLTGTADIFSENAAGDCMHLARVKKGALLGEMSLMTSQPHKASVIAASQCEVAILPVPVVDRLMREAPEFGACLAELIAGRIGNGSGDVLIGETLNEYQIQSFVGRGGMATVYKATELSSGRVVALKMMNHSLIYDRTAVARFEREAKIIASLQHEHIVCVHDFFSEFLTRFLVMEYCAGCDLSQLIRTCGALSEVESRAVLGQIARGLGFAHQNEVVHRDLKPSNVVVDRDGTVKLMDFGLAISATSSTLTAYHTCLGTPRYMAPEQLAGQDVDFRADIYAFGCVAYELVAGEPLFDGSLTAETLRQRLNSELPVRSQLPVELSDEYFELIRRCLAGDPATRSVNLEEISEWARPVETKLPADAPMRSRWMAQTIVSPSIVDSDTSD